jgi:hypothetical protein
MRNIKEELKGIKGGDFPKWYANLTKLEKVEYSIALKQLNKEFRS